MSTLPTISERQRHIVEALRIRPGTGMASLRVTFPDTSVATIKRDISQLITHGYLQSSGGGRSIVYAVTRLGALYNPLDAHTYCAVDPDTRVGFERYDFELFNALPASVFSDSEQDVLNTATRTYRERSVSLSDTLRRKELERFVIELSWKSSRIEGNTYTLLDTERLINEGIEASGHSHDEATMILNHKEAFNFVTSQSAQFLPPLRIAAVEEVHKRIVQDLGIGHGLRQQVVGVVGTKYRPLDNQYQIREALESLLMIIGKSKDAYTAALYALAGLSYIQPFEDGNKRTARLVTNAILFARGAVPLSYRSVDEVLYREATLVFYETHSLIPLKKILTEQYLFAANQYGLITRTQ